MGKRKKSSRKPGPSRRKEPLETSFTCLFCHHDKSVTVKIVRKEGYALLSCKVCGQSYQSKINHLTEPVDVFSEWLDAADEAARDVGGSGDAMRPNRTIHPELDIDNDNDDD